MGSSPSASVFYGYDLGTLDDPDTWRSLKPSWWNRDSIYDCGWEDELARRLGWVAAPFPDDYPLRRDYDAYNEYREALAAYDSPAYRAWDENREQRAALVAQVPVELVTYGSDDGDITWALRAKKSVHTVDDWGSIELPPLIVSQRWGEDIKRFVELLELTVPDGPPAWHLNCSYG